MTFENTPQINTPFDLSIERIIRIRLQHQYPDVAEEFFIQYNKQNKCIDGNLDQNNIYIALKKSADICNIPETFINQCIEDCKNFREDESKTLTIESLQPKIFSLLIQRKRPQASEIIVNFIKSREIIFTTRDDDNSEVWIYKEGIYIPQGQTFIKEYVRKVLIDNYTSTICNEVISKIEVDTYISQEDFFKEEDINLICLKNGIYNIKKKGLIPHSSEYRFFQKLPVSYVKGAKCVNIVTFLSEILKCDIEIIQELFGFLLLRDYRFEKAFMLIGNGRNGKGKLISLMKCFLGVNSCCNLSLEAIETDMFAIGELFGKLANLAGDISKTALRNTGNFKSLTGRDLISASRKFRTRISFVNYAKLIFAGNELPLSYDLSFAFFNRWILIEFPYTFINESEYNKLEDKTNYKLDDKQIIDKISTQDELDGLFNFALEGLYHLLGNKQFSTSNTTEETKTKWLRKADSFQAFCMDCCVFQYDYEIEKSELRKYYATYCREHKLKPSSDKAIKTILFESYGCGDRKSGNEYSWTGIALIENGQGGHDGQGISPYRENIKKCIEVKQVSKLSTLSKFDDPLKICEEKVE